MTTCTHGVHSEDGAGHALHVSTCPVVPLIPDATKARRHLSDAGYDCGPESGAGGGLWVCYCDSINGGGLLGGHCAWQIADTFRRGLIGDESPLTGGTEPDGEPGSGLMIHRRAYDEGMRQGDDINESGDPIHEAARANT